ncbi:XdhC family protein [Ancylobacter terrae]|uniref:XdhC family protein n=1 Tax=Ancylobacter sp. sgz301288 TaxID=3342077 RepID=UPI003859402B
MELAVLEALNAERSARRAAVLVTELPTGAQRLVRAGEAASDPLAEPIIEALRTARSGIITLGNQRFFLTVQVPPPRLVIIGAVHISQALAPMAQMTGFDVTIVDPRTAFATPERFPDVVVRAEWPDVVLPELALDPFTALVALTHDPKIDDPALAEALRGACFYIGALGSRKTHGARVERLVTQGFSRDLIGRIHAPIGLDIGAASPAEIAVAILAEVVAALRQRPLRREQAA